MTFVVMKNVILLTDNIFYIPVYVVKLRLAVFLNFKILNLLN